MFAIVKCFATGRKRKVLSTDLHELKMDDPARMEYSPFQPKSSVDFIKRKYYGQIVNGNMNLLFILFMSDDQASRDNAFDNANLGNPKRMSLEDDPFIPLQNFAVFKEKNENTEGKQIKAKKRVKDKQNSEIISKVEPSAKKAKPPASKKTTNDSVKNKKNKLAVMNEQSASILAKVRKSSKPLVTSPQNVSTDFNLDASVTASCSGTSKTLQEQHSATQSVVRQSPQAKETTSTACPECLIKDNEILELNEKLKFAAESIQELNNNQESLIKDNEILELKEKLKFAVESIQDLTNNRESLLQEIRLLKDSSLKLETLNRENQKLIDEIAELTNEMEGQKSERCAFTNPSPNTVVYCKDGLIIKKQDLADVELCNKFSSRVNSLAELYWPGRVHTMGLTKMAGRSVISDAQVSLMTGQLNNMIWDDSEVLHAYKTAFPKKNYDADKIASLERKISTGLVRSQLRRTTNFKRHILQSKCAERKALRKDTDEAETDEEEEVAQNSESDSESDGELLPNTPKKE